MENGELLQLPVNRTFSVLKTISFLLAENRVSPLGPVMLKEGELNRTISSSVKLNSKLYKD